MKRCTLKVMLFLANLLMILSIAIPVFYTATSDVIGGADWPTFLFHFRKTLWIGLLGLLLWIISNVALFPRKK